MTKQTLIQKLINPTKFIAERPAMNAFSDDEINEGIYTAFNLINAECRGLPIKVWEYNYPAYEPHPQPVEKNNPLYRNEHEIDQFFQAVVSQAQYTLNMGNDYSQGSSTFSTGGMSATIQRPERRDVLAPGVLLFLQNARLYQLQEYDLNQTKENLNPCEELKKYLTYEEGDKRYVAEYQPNSPEGAVAIIDHNHTVVFEDASTIDFKSYKADTILDTDGNYKKIQDINNLAFYGPSGTDAIKRVEAREMIDNSLFYKPTWTYRRNEIIATYNANKNYIDLWQSNYDGNIGHDPVLDNVGYYWWKKLENTGLKAKEIFDPVDGVFKLINQFDVTYFGGLTKLEVYNAIQASGTVWSKDTRYRQDFVVIHVTSKNVLTWYKSLQNLNINNNPETSPLWWEKLPAPVVDVSSVINQVKPFIKQEVDKAVADAINKAKTGLTTDFSGSIYQFTDAQAFNDFIAANPKLRADMFEDINFTSNSVLLTSDQVVAGVKTFTSKCKADIDPTEPEGIANKRYVDDRNNHNVWLNGDQTINGNKEFRGVTTLGTHIQVGYGGAEIKITPEDNSQKTLRFGNNPNNDNKRIETIHLDQRTWLTGIREPNSAYDAVNKAYVDARVGGVQQSYVDNNFYNRSYINANFFTQSQSDNRYYQKSYIDNNYYTSSYINSNYVSLNGDQTIQGNKRFYRPLDMTGERVFNVATPTDARDATNKEYVDNNFLRAANNQIRIQRPIRFYCNDVANFGPLARYYMTTRDASLFEKRFLLSMEHGGNFFYPVKAGDDYVDIIANQGVFSRGQNYVFTITSVAERTY